MTIFRKKFYINRPFWIFADNGKFHINGSYVDGVFNPEKSYSLVNQAIKKSKYKIKVVY